MGELRWDLRHGLPVAVCHRPVTGLHIHVNPLWRDLTHVAQHRQPPLADEQRALVHAARAALARDLSETAVSDLEALIGLSRSRLSSLFRRSTGLTMGEYRNRVRLEIAKALLVHTDASVLHIALEVGYSTAAALTRVFQPSVGVSPGEFRRLAQEVAGGRGVKATTATAVKEVVEQTGRDGTGEERWGDHRGAGLRGDWQRSSGLSLCHSAA